ncbi:LMBRL protein, partial [Ciccaba nigrolineata]|nr:LMBRL protein [Ciccaba nigrolineata]
ELRHRASPWQRNLGYPLAMLGLLALTESCPTLGGATHRSPQPPSTCRRLLSRQDASLGQVSFSIFGSFGAALQVVLILLGAPLPHPMGALSPHEPLGVSSLAGKASCWLNLNVELLREQFFAIRSKRRKLGITRFDLLGDFGRFNWLGNFYIVFLYNMGFAGLTTLC